ncbi:glycosyltransferase family 2 protein [Gymnodinialimonas ulvae]|uniref:glycosyltransferase family 2 protein n=1 Tax=Gymnodinialimonas ulvae TaxID=3126504 RepID=UPI0030B5222C
MPDLPRPDVSALRGGPADQGFSVAIPATARQITLDLMCEDGTVQSAPIPHPSDPVGAQAQGRLHRAFLRDLCRALPAFLRYARDPTDRAKADIKRVLGLELASRGADLERAWLLEEPKTAAAAPTDEVTILLPVFNAFDLLKRCLSRVEQHTDVNWHLVLVEDASTDRSVRPWLTQWAKARVGRVTLLCQEANQGFVAAVNTGLEHLQKSGGTGPIVLLNSDAMVPPNWASRLCAPLSDPSVASVTPMSNAAEILSVPSIGPGVSLAEGEAAQIDTIAQGLGAVPLPELPTGVGFCMALSRHWLEKVPQLDPTFGRGYGEEVDWCQKTRALGAHHLAQPALFVEHVGGQSFGSAEKRARIRAAGALISRRYPRYDAEVQRFIANDALATPRLALAVALAAARSPRMPVFLAHALGGGAEAALRAELSGRPAGIVLRVGGQRRWLIEVHVADEIVTGRTDDLDLVRRLLAPAKALDLIYSCGVGDSDPIGLPAALLSLRRTDRADRMMMRLHDYFPLSPSYTLMGRDGFAGVPAPDTSDPCHIIRRPDGTHMTLADWRAAWGQLVEACDEITSFSQASADLFSQAFEGANVTVRPHVRPVPVRPLDTQAGRRIGILGNLNIQKGALLIRELAMARPRQTFVVIGHVDSTIPLPRNVVIHGGYDRDEITELTELYGIRAWLMPAVWPETFSFATREALATGLPVAGFSLGAQGEALRDAPNGITVPLEPKSGAAARLFSTIDPDRLHQVAAE